MYRATNFKARSCKGKKEESRKSAAQSPFVFRGSVVLPLTFTLWDHSFLLSSGQLLTPGRRPHGVKPCCVQKENPCRNIFFSKSRTLLFALGGGEVRGAHLRIILRAFFLKKNLIRRKNKNKKIHFPSLSLTKDFTFLLIVRIT